jgi:hypothetical protein
MAEVDPPRFPKEEPIFDQDRERWTKLVAEFETSDVSQREFAKQRIVALSNFRYWSYRLRKESRPLVTEQPDARDHAH